MICPQIGRQSEIRLCTYVHVCIWEGKVLRETALAEAMGLSHEHLTAHFMVMSPERVVDGHVCLQRYKRK